MKPVIGWTTRASRLALVASLSTFLVCVQFPFAAMASDGDLDLSFGNAGKVTTAFFSGTSRVFLLDIVSSVAIQSDGKIVAAGKVDQAPPQVGIDSVFGLARYSPDGSLDQSFGSGGKVVTEFSGGSAAISAVAIQPDGKLVAMGSVSPAPADLVDSEFAVARYNSDGSLDASFGFGGKVATDLGRGPQVGAAAGALQPDGKIILAGSVIGRVTYNLALARFNADGSPDVGFGIGGSVITELPGSSGAQQILALALQSDGRIVAAGTNSFNLTLGRYNPDGSLDSSFGSGGLVTTPVSSLFNVAHSIAIQPDGRIVAVGAAVFPNDTSGSLVVVRYNSDGTRDMAFGEAGAAVIPKGSGEAVAIQPDGKILAAGLLEGPFSVLSFLLARFNPDGRLDAGFGSSGMASTRFIDDGRAYAIALQKDGRAILAGTSYDSANLHADFALARYQVTGSPAPDFGLVASPSTITLSRGAKGSVEVNILRQGGFNGAVTVTAPDTSAIKIRISPSSDSTTGSILAFACKAKGKAQPGQYPLSFVGGDDSGRTHSCTVTVIVQ